MPSICLVAGDPSGDARAAAVVDVLKRLRSDCSFTGLGGPQMRRAGVALLDDLTPTASIGPFDALRHLQRFARAKALLRELFRRRKPDLVILVDFGDFNLPVVAPLAKRAGCRVVYYISPQLWAWGRFRLRWIRRYVDRMLVLFRFEEAFYQRLGIPVTWVGHPLVDPALQGGVETRASSRPREQAMAALGLNPWRMTVGLLPGSRAQEIRRHLPVFLDAASRIAWRMPGAQFLVPTVPGIPPGLLEPLATPRATDLMVSERPMAECLPAMEVALIASGTATLEAALMEVPMVVVYRTSWPTYLAARAVIRVPHIAMVNVIAGKEVVPEYVQHRARPARIAQEIVGLLRQAQHREAMRQELRKVREALGPQGAVERTARAILSELPR
ncbi:MAG TPA: lipid-A-disaccharide synthase [Candidatus Omnitrophica bacterium]|nr:MAG: lipid-A-disaccharide synthase [Omnitrophica WOR_2 bacterium GWA2_63_20]OGX16823.1 MAG: lipid-A-disaccharide synthase [Omnitrophica WOR_2 bacterium GWF2_63_9]OGX35143.1 MAG: lipid-A-disaccharide synthase [Omnitrophica WOR_2 bacterium RIFCSPHIGHO2_02_FULL_63_39]OGX45573.1 MAG: lipid-A-disaccharide synthase [Omnitrophica WOR_2 bacterium RIFCSPLOWO2_02_FULL_63_16]OGX48455.1 MAG: lipid-A-disaccharide synthase [Omnitrophica WOR_2 bacterium RIFCSPLOWO2_12_FULL_63_16]HAM41929.1 lipid-A-disacch